MEKELPKIYEPSLYEDEIYKKWLDNGAFDPDNLKLPADAKGYSIIMPPPNVTGTLHMGHAAMLAIEDILTRFYRMRGYYSLWIPGTDHAAIATQTKVEKIIKEEGTDRHKLGREKFLERVNQFAQDSHDTIVNQVKKMGCSCDWSREAYTLDAPRTKAVRAVFKLMYDDGLIYRGERIVNWCPRCHSTLADDEVEYKEQKANLYTFKYSADFPFTIATTRPETKLGDTAVAVNPKDERYKEYVGKTYEVDFAGVPLKLKIIADRNVDMDFGTGALGVTPAHSLADWQMAEENNLEIIKVIDEDGKIHAGIGDYGGMTALAAREKVVMRLKDAGLMLKEEEIDNKLSLCYRCDTPIEPLPSLQWFIDVNKKIPKYGKSIKELSIDAVREGVFGREKIKIVPERFEKNYFNWMENLRDWCISRQIWFGHQVPVWYKKNSKFKIQNSKLTSDELYVGIEPPKGDGWEQDEDTLDTWFSSGLWTFSTMAHKPEEIRIEDGKLIIESADFKKFHPTAVLETGYDILFFWVARMIIMTVYAVGDIPFQDVYLHGLVLDEHGKKMSKSKGNVIDPLDMNKKYGADATRLSLVIGSTPGNDLRLAEEKIAGFRNLINKIWNISRYIITGYSLEGKITDLDISQLTKADEWIIFKMQVLIKQVADDLADYRFSHAGEKLYEFTWDILADWYLEASKFEKSGEKEKVMRYVLSSLLTLWHPYIPFVTEKVWETYNDGLLITEFWPQNITDSHLSTEFELVRELIMSIRNARSENKIEPAKKIKAVIYGKDKAELIRSQEILIKSLRTGIEDIEVKIDGEKIDGAIYCPVGEIEVYLIGAIDTAKEKIRLEKEIANLTKIINATEGKLANEEFISKAPAAVVEKEKEKLAGWQGECEKLKERLEEQK